MKSRTSSFNTALRKNITRFAPCWVLYTIGLVMILLTMPLSGYWFASSLAEWISIMAVINLVYALLTAQLLFGDLFNSRMCNALHAMPLRREGWYAASVTAGLLFSLIPTLITSLIALPICAAGNVINGWQIPLYWLLGSNLSYICFFGIAALCVQLTGNRFAMAVVYGILNFGAVILYWLVDTLYTPMVYGVRTWAEPFFKLTPVVHLAEEEYLEVTRHYVNDIVTHSDFTVSPVWGRFFVWAGVGLLLMGLALLLYRKRKLECAGDFMAFRKMEPVFLIIYTLIVGTCFQFFASNIIGGIGGIAYLFVGLAVGWFTGRMLLKRTIRVFQWKAIGGCALVMVLLGISLVLTAMDVFGIASWMPKVSEVRTAYVTLGYHYTGNIPNGAIRLTDPADIEKVLHAHEIARTPQEDPRVHPIPVEAYDGTVYYEYADTQFTFTLTYQLKNGQVVNRYYIGYADTEIGEILIPWFSRIEAALGVSEEDLDRIADTVVETYIDGVENLLTREQTRSLLDAIAADCRAGHMAQRWSFHTAECGDRAFNVEFSYRDQERLHYWLSVTVYNCCENVHQWMDDNDMWDILEESSGKY